MMIRSVIACCGIFAFTLAAQEASAPPPPPPPPAVFSFSTSGSFLGVGVREINAERARELKLAEEYGVEITKVDSNSPAEKAGLKTGDVVTQYNGQRVEGTEQFVRFVRETPVGRTVRLGIIRGGAAQTLAATIASRKAAQAIALGKIPNLEGLYPSPKFEVMIPDIPKAMMSWRSSMLGVEAESLGDSQLASFFGVKEGVLVRGVIKDSAAEKAGIKAGDVLLKVDDAKVASPRDVTSAIRNARSSDKTSVAVVLMRDRKESTLTVTLDPVESEVRPRGARVREMRF